MSFSLHQCKRTKKIIFKVITVLLRVHCGLAVSLLHRLAHQILQHLLLGLGKGRSLRRGQTVKLRLTKHTYKVSLRDSSGESELLQMAVSRLTLALCAELLRLFSGSAEAIKSP